MQPGHTEDCVCPFLDACDAHMLHRILERLDARDLASVERSCRALRDAGRDTQLWAKLCDKRFGHAVHGEDTQHAFRSLRDEFARCMLPFHGLMTDVGVDEPAKDFWAHKLFVASPRSMFCTAASIQNAHVWGVLSPWTDHEAVYSWETASGQASRWGRQEEASKAPRSPVGPEGASFSDDACVQEILSGSTRLALQRVETSSLHRPLLMRRLIHVAEVLVPPTGQGPGTQSKAVHARALAALEHVSTRGLEDLLRLSYAAMAAMLSQRRVLGEPLGKALMEGVESPMQIAGLRGLAQDVMFGTSPTMLPDIQTFSEQSDPEASEASSSSSESNTDKAGSRWSLPLHAHFRSLSLLSSLGHNLGSVGSRLLSPPGSGGERSSTCRAGGPLYDKHAMLLALRHAHAAQRQGQAASQKSTDGTDSAQPSSQGEDDAHHTARQAADPAPVCVGLMEELLLSSHQHVTCPVKSGAVFSGLVPPRVARHLSKWQEGSGETSQAQTDGSGQSLGQREGSKGARSQAEASSSSSGSAQQQPQQQKHQQQQQQKQRGRAVMEGAAQDLLQFSSHPMVQACNNMTQAQEVLEASATGLLPPVYNWFSCREGEWIEFDVPPSEDASPAIAAPAEGPQGSSSTSLGRVEGEDSARPRMHRVLEEAQLAPVVWFRVYTHDESEQWEEQQEAQLASQPAGGVPGTASTGSDGDSDFKSGESASEGHGDDGGGASPAYDSGGASPAYDSGGASPAYEPSLDDIFRGKPAATAQQAGNLRSRPPCPPLDWPRVRTQLLEARPARQGQASSSSGPPQLPIQPVVVNSSMWEYSGVQPQASPNIAQAAPEFACSLGWGIHSDAPPGCQGQLHMRLHRPRPANCLLVKLIASHDLQPAFNRLRGGCNLDMGYVSSRGRRMALPAALRACGLSS